MSMISDIYDEIQTRVTGLLPTHTLLPHTSRIEANPETFLRQGLFISYKEGLNGEKTVNCQTQTTRTIQIGVTRVYFTTELNRTHTENIEKQLLEDFEIIKDDFEKIPTLNIPLVTEYPTLVYKTDNGIENVFDDKDNVIKIVGSFELNYEKNL